jgi:hypothetical protein
LASATTQNNYAGVSIPLIDLTSVFISNANGVALGLIQPTSIDSTNTHGTAAGYFTIAKQVAAVIAQTPSTPSSDYAYNSLMNYNPYTGILQSYVPLGSANPAYIYGGGFALTAYMNGSTLDWYAGEFYGSTWRACYQPANKCPLNLGNNSLDGILNADSTGLRFGDAGAGNLNIFHSLPEGSIVTAASTIVPPMEIFHLTGTVPATTVNVMTPPAAYSYGAATYNLYSGTLDFIADSAIPFAAGTSIGSFATAFTTVPGMTYHCVYTASTGLWYCK